MNTRNSLFLSVIVFLAIVPLIAFQLWKWWFVGPQRLPPIVRQLLTAYPSSSTYKEYMEHFITGKLTSSNGSVMSPIHQVLSPAHQVGAAVYSDNASSTNLVILHSLRPGFSGICIFLGRPGIARQAGGRWYFLASNAFYFETPSFGAPLMDEDFSTVSPKE